MADRCVFFADLLELPPGRQRTYILLESKGTGLVCLDARLRQGGDWYFARKWVPIKGGSRELYRWMDRLEARGFRFHISTVRAGPRESEAHGWRTLSELRLRASELHRDLTEDERRIHRDLFPEEADLLGRGYDWDGQNVYSGDRPLSRDEHGRILDTDGDVLYEWVRDEDEFTWRRYPLERVRVMLTPRGT